MYVRWNHDMLYPSFQFSSITACPEHFDTPGIREAIYTAVMSTFTAMTSRRSYRSWLLSWIPFISKSRFDNVVVSTDLSYLSLKSPNVPLISETWPLAVLHQSHRCLIHPKILWLMFQEPRLGGIFTFVLYNDRQGCGAQAGKKWFCCTFGQRYVNVRLA